MPINDIPRFLIILLMIVCIMACIIKAFDVWHEAIKEKRRNERIRLKIEWAEKSGKFDEWKKEASDGDEDDSPRG